MGVCVSAMKPLPPPPISKRLHSQHSHLSQSGKSDLSINALVSPTAPNQPQQSKKSSKLESPRTVKSGNRKEGELKQNSKPTAQIKPNLDDYKWKTQNINGGLNKPKRIPEAMDSSDPRLPIDELPYNIFARIGEKACRNAAANFYTRVYNDEKWFSGAFTSPIDVSVAEQTWYLTERFGGPKVDMRQSLHCHEETLNSRHTQFPITKKHADRWMEHMRGAIDDLSTQGFSLPEDFAPAFLKSMQMLCDRFVNRT